MGSLIVIAVIAALDLSQPLVLDEDVTTITIVPVDNTELHELIRSIATDPDENIVLRLSGIDASKQTGDSWEVRVAPVGAADCDGVPGIVGYFSAFGVTPDTEFVYRLDEVIPAANCGGLNVIFEPTSAIAADGKPKVDLIRGSMRINRITLERDSATER